MTGKLCGQVIKSGFLSNSRANILFALASVSDGHGESWYAYAALAHLARCTRKTAITEIKWLESRGIVMVRRGGSLRSTDGHRIRCTNLYILNLEFLNALNQLVEYIRKTPGNSADKWRVVGRAAKWVEDRVENFEWRIVVDLIEESPHGIMQACMGDDEPC